MGTKIYRDEDWLKEKYWGEEMTLEEIADEAGVVYQTIQTWMDKHDIPRRNFGGPRKGYANYRMTGTGHMAWESWTQEEGNRYMLVHRLLAVAEYGTDAVKDKHVHHKNEIPWDNRMDNLEVLSVHDHRSYHAKKNNLSELGTKARYG